MTMVVDHTTPSSPLPNLPPPDENLFSRVPSSSGSKVSGDPPRAFHCIKFATTAQSGRAGATPPRKDGAPPGGQDGEELLAVSASLQLFHFANVPIAAVEVRPCVGSL